MKGNQPSRQELKERLARAESDLAAARQKQQKDEQLERARAEAVEHANRLEAVLAVLPVGVAIVDERGGNVQANEQFRRIWAGVRRATDINDYTQYKGWWADSGRPVQPAEWAASRAVLKGETVTGQILQIERFDGSRAVVHNSAAPIRAADGRIIGAAVAIQEVTALRQAEAEMRSMARFPEENPNPVMRMNREGELLYANPAAQPLVKAWKSGPGLPLPAELRERAAACVREARPMELEAAVAGRFYWFAFSPGAKGEYANVYGRDITERKSIEDALRHSEAMLAEAQQMANVGSWEWDIPSGGVVWSDQTCRMFGVEPGRFTPSRDSFLAGVHADDRQRVAQAIEQALSGGGRYDLDYRVVRPDSSVRWVYARGDVARDGNGRPVRMAGTVLDITERKLAEEALARQNAILVGVNSVLQSALETPTEEDFGQTCLAVAEAVTGSRISFIGEIGPDGLLHDLAISNPAWELCSAYDHSGHRRPPGNFAIHGIYGRVASDGKSLIVNDPASHPDRIGLPEGHPPICSFLGVPLFRGGKITGMIAVGNREGGYGPGEQRALEALAPVIVEALAHKRAAAERGRLLAQVQSQQALLDAVIEHLPVGIGIAEAPSGRLLRINEQTRRIWGLDAMEAADSSGYGKYAGFHPDGRQYSSEDWQLVRALAGDVIRGEEIEFVRGDGVRRVMRSNAGPVKDASGRVVAAVVVIDDITDHKQAEEALRRAKDGLELRVKERTAELELAAARLEQQIAERRRAEKAVEAERRRFLDVLETLPVMICLLTPDHHVMFANRAMRAAFGTAAGRKCFEYQFNRTEPCPECQAFVPLQTGKPHDWEWTIPDGRTIEIHNFPFTDTDGSPLILEMDLDITARKRAERTIRSQNLMLEAFFRFSPKPLAVLDRDFNFVRVNESYALADNRPVEEFIGRNHFELFPNEENEAIFRRVVENRQPFLAVAKPFVYAEHPERGTSYWDWAAVPLMGDSGQVEFVVFHLENVTERVQAELAIKQANEQLRQRAEQLRALAAELTLTEQRERRRMARVLHDHLQQLLVGAKFRLTVLGRHADTVVQQATREVERLLDDAIQSSRSLTAELSPPILHEGGLNAGLEWLARWMAERQGLFVDLTCEPETAPLVEDVKVLLYEAVRELLFNAVKHANTRSAIVNVRRVQGQVQVVVSDEGAGFDPEAIPRAGEKGGGFGLFSIRERLDLIGGRLEIDSAPGKGSRFVLTAPSDPLPAPPLEPPPAVASGDEGKRALAGKPLVGPKIRVLVADDHAVMRQGLEQLLGREPDIEVVGGAADGQEAVQLAARLLPDAILMDMSMPVLNGVEATRAIHNDYPEIRIIGLSMFEEAERAQTMRDAGAVAYVTKSGPAEQLIAAIRTACANLGSGHA